MHARRAHGSATWTELKKSLKTSILSSQANKQCVSCVVLSSLAWSVLSTILLCIAYLSSANQEFSLPIKMGDYQGPRWHNEQQTVHRKVLVENAWLSLSQHTVQVHDGPLIDDWLWVDTANQINVMVTTMVGGKERFVIFEQTKYGFDGLSYATVGGHIDVEDHEDGLVAAKRELMEEMGMRSEEWVSFGKFRTDVNRGLGFCHTFLARKAQQVKKMAKYEDETESMQIKHVSMTQLMRLYNKRLFKEAKWSNTVGLSLMWMLKHSDMNAEMA